VVHLLKASQVTKIEQSVQERQAEKTYHQLRNVPFANNAMPLTVERSRELPVTSNNHANFVVQTACA
jgi:hypothetical protein